MKIINFIVLEKIWVQELFSKKRLSSRWWTTYKYSPYIRRQCFNLFSFNHWHIFWFKLKLNPDVNKCILARGHPWMKLKYQALIFHCMPNFLWEYISIMIVRCENVCSNVWKFLERCENVCSNVWKCQRRENTWWRCQVDLEGVKFISSWPWDLNLRFDLDFWPWLLTLNLTAIS